MTTPRVVKSMNVALYPLDSVERHIHLNGFGSSAQGDRLTDPDYLMRLTDTRPPDLA